MTFSKPNFAIAALALGFQVLNAQQNISITGLDSDNEGVFAWNINGGNTGHLIPAPYNAFGNDTAYYHLSSRDVDNIDLQSTAGMHGTGSVTGFPLFMAALNTHGKTLSEVKIQFDGATLGNDIEGTDWSFTGSLENRKYKGGHYAILINTDTLVTGQCGTTEINIEYNSELTPFDDQISGNTDYSTPTIAASGSINTDLATALLNDISNKGVRINFSSLQRAGQTEYNSNGITGAFFEIQQATLETGTATIPSLGNAIQTACQGDSIKLDAGANRDTYLWNTGATTQFIYSKNSGEYYVIVDSAGVIGVSNKVKTEISICTSTNENVQLQNTFLFPNPANQSIKVSTEHPISKIEIYDLTGKKLSEENTINNSSSTIEIQTSHLANNVYFMQVTSNTGATTKIKFNILR